MDGILPEEQTSFLGVEVDETGHTLVTTHSDSETAIMFFWY